MNISSIIVKINSKKWDEAIDMITKIPHVEIALQDRQKESLIAIIEAPDTNLEIKALNSINTTPGVISANMHLSYNEDSFESCVLEAGEIAKLIDTTPIEDIRYNGDINTFLKPKK